MCIIVPYHSTPTGFHPHSWVLFLFFLQRLDGRQTYDYRKIKISFGTDYGCCFVDLGQTRWSCSHMFAIVCQTEHLCTLSSVFTVRLPAGSWRRCRASWWLLKKTDRMKESCSSTSSCPRWPHRDLSREGEDEPHSLNSAHSFMFAGI